MEYKILKNDEYKTSFNIVVHHPMQLWEWGELRKSEGTTVVRVVGFEGKEIKEALQFTLHPLPIVGYSVGYAPRGSKPSKELLDFLFDWGKQHKISHITFEPNIQKKNAEGLLQIRSNLVWSGHTMFTPWQFLLDLTKDEEMLLKNMKSKTRYNVHLAERKGVKIREAKTKQDVEIFIQMYLDTCTRQSYHGRDATFLRTVWKYLGGKYAFILIAYKGNEALASYMLFLHNGVLYYPYGGSSKKGRKIMPANLLMWRTIQFGKQHDARMFDMWGALGSEYNLNDPWIGFTRFKEGYGGTRVEFVHSFDLVMNPRIRLLYEFLYQSRKCVWSMQRKLKKYKPQ